MTRKTAMDHQARRLCRIGTDCSPASRRAPRRGAGGIGGGPPGSAGVPPACTPVASRSVSLRCPTPSPCRWKQHGLGRSSVRAPLPVYPGGGDGHGCARTCAGGTPALPGGPQPMTSSQQRSSIGLCVCSWFVFNNHRQFHPQRILFQPPQRGCIHRQRQSNIRARDAGRQARPEGRPCHS